MLKNLKKILLLSAVLFVFFGMGIVSAHSDHSDSKDEHGKYEEKHSYHNEREDYKDREDYERPKIEKVSSEDNHSAVIKFKYKKNHGEKVTVKVKVYNEKTDKKFTEKFKKVKLDCKGKGKVKVDCLKAGVKYCFKVKVKGRCDCEYSCNSKCKCVKVDP